jgi:hypothetical protein
MPASAVTALPTQPKRSIRAPFVPQLTGLSFAEMVVALHASDYVLTPRPGAADLARFAVQGMERMDRLTLARLALELMEYWLTVARLEDTSQTQFLAMRRAHTARFDAARVSHLESTVRRNHRTLFATAQVAGVAA